MQDKEKYMLALALAIAIAVILNENENEFNKHNSISLIKRHVLDTKFRTQLLNNNNSKNSKIDVVASSSSCSSSSSTYHQMLDEPLIQWLFCRHTKLSSSKVNARLESILMSLASSSSTTTTSTANNLSMLKSTIANDMFLGVSSSEHSIDFIQKIIKTEEFVHLYPRLSILMITCIVECINLLCCVESHNPVDHLLINERSPLLADVLSQLLQYVIQDQLNPIDFNTNSHNPGNGCGETKMERALNMNMNNMNNMNMNMKVNVKQQSIQWVAEQLSDAMMISYRLPSVHEKLTNLALNFFGHP